MKEPVPDIPVADEAPQGFFQRLKKGPRQLKEDHHTRLVALSASFSFLILFLLLVSLAPYLGERLGFLSRQEKPKSFAQETSTEAQVEYVSNEILVKIKSPEYNKVKKDPKSQDTGISSLDKLNKENQVVKFERVVKPSKKLKNPNHDVFRWYQVTLEGEQEIIKEPLNPELQDWESIELSSKSQKLKSTLAKYKEDVNIEKAEPNYIVHTTAIPNDTYADPEQDGTWSTGAWSQSYEDLWGLKKIEVDKAWDIITGSEEVVVAVIDTGVDYNHPDLQQNMWTNSGEVPNNGIDDDGNGFVDDVRGWDFTNNDNNPMDDHGHGTHVAGIIGAVGNNAAGIVGVNWRVKVMVLKFLNNELSGTLNNAVGAMIYAAHNGAKVLNNSWGFPGTSQSIHDAVDYSYDVEGAIVVAAAGNSNTDASGITPANEPKVVTVSAFDHNDVKADFSNFGTPIDIAAPGGDSFDFSSNQQFLNILSLKASSVAMFGSDYIVGADYYRYRGTSMAAPYVSGAATLLWAFGAPSNSVIVQALYSGADDVGDPGRDQFSGSGRLNVYKALKLDSDQDGFPDLLEAYLGTDPSKSCPVTSTADDETVDAWPPDFNNNQIVGIDDIFAVSSRFGLKKGDVNYSPRYELASQNGIIEIDDVYAVSSRFNQSCTP